MPGDRLRSWDGLRARYMYHCMCGYATVSRMLMEGHECCGRRLRIFERDSDLFDYGSFSVDRWDVGAGTLELRISRLVGRGVVREHMLTRCNLIWMGG